MESTEPKPAPTSSSFETNSVFAIEGHTVSTSLVLQDDRWHAQFSIRPPKYNLYRKTERLSFNGFFETRAQARAWLDAAPADAVGRLISRNK